MFARIIDTRSKADGYGFECTLFRVDSKAKYTIPYIFSNRYKNATMKDESGTGNIVSIDKNNSKTARFKTRSTIALEEVYFSSYTQLVKMARVLVDDISIASDVVQEAFVKALSVQPNFENSDATSYMKTAVMNQARSTLRKRGVSRKHLSSLSLEDTQIEENTKEELPVDAQVIQKALQTISQRQRECIMLSHTYSMTHKEIAKELGISEGSVKQHLSRGLKSLSDVLKDAK